MKDFLDENNACAQNLLRHVSMGNAIIAEILRVKDHIPQIFRLETKAEQQKYGDIIFDFSQLKALDARESKITQSDKLRELDNKLREEHNELIARFHLVFENVYHYAAVLQEFIEELNNGYYIRQSLESLMQDAEGKQLMCESLYIFGVILLLLDYHIPGIVRERLLIAYYRYNASSSKSDYNFDDICMLLSATSYNKKSTLGFMLNKEPNSGYPEAYFSRYQLNAAYVEHVISRLRSDDVYNQLSVYAQPNCRSTALATQASMLFVCLFFAPQMLHTQPAAMHEIVDKFFTDTWVVSVYMGWTVNLQTAWQAFKAARMALAPQLEATAIKTLCTRQRALFTQTYKDNKNMLKDGALQDSTLLENIDDLIALLRRSNVLLRWYFLHAFDTITTCCALPQKPSQLQQTLRTALNFKQQELFEFLLMCSQLELMVKELICQLIEERTERWLACKTEAQTRLAELSEIFAGTRPLAKIESNSQLQAWFGQLAESVGGAKLDSDVNKSANFIVQIVKALEDVQELRSLQSNLQVRQYLQESRDYLLRMLQLVNITEDTQIRIQIISDFSYAWILIDRNITETMMERIREEPQSLGRLRAVFLKLASALEIPLMRINQAKSDDLLSVSNYYSTELANYMQKVLHVIPHSVYEIQERIRQLLTYEIKEFPARFEADKLSEYMQYEARYELSKLTSSIADYSEGIIKMKKTLVGVIELDPKQMLEEGMRKEFVQSYTRLLHDEVTQSRPGRGRSRVAELQERIDALAKIMRGYQSSFGYIEDYLHINCLQILLEEQRRVTSYYVEREINALLSRELPDWQSTYQSQALPIPSFEMPTCDEANKSDNYIGRIARELLQCTEPGETVYVQLTGTWYNKQALNQLVLNADFFELLVEALEPCGMVGLDRIYAHMIHEAICANLSKLQHKIQHEKMWMDTLAELTNELEAPDFPGAHAKNPLKFYNTYVSRWLKVWPILLDWLLQIGHKQILRQQIAYALNLTVKLHAKDYEAALAALNRAFLHELRTNEQAYTATGLEQLNQLMPHLMLTGNYEPMEQIYVKTTTNSHCVPLLMLLFTLSFLPRLEYSNVRNSLLPKSPKDTIDAEPLVHGLLTMFQQYHPSVRELYIFYVSQYIKAVAEMSLSIKKQLSPEVVIAVQYLKFFIKFARLEISVLEEHIPKLLLHRLEELSRPPAKSK